MGEDVTVLQDEIEAYDDGTVARVRVLAQRRIGSRRVSSMPFTTAKRETIRLSSGTTTTTVHTRFTWVGY
jgi:hypothetical protein